MTMTAHAVCSFFTFTHEGTQLKSLHFLLLQVILSKYTLKCQTKALLSSDFHKPLQTNQNPSNEADGLHAVCNNNAALIRMPCVGHTCISTALFILPLTV